MSRIQPEGSRIRMQPACTVRSVVTMPAPRPLCTLAAPSGLTDSDTFQSRMRTFSFAAPYAPWPGTFLVAVAFVPDAGGDLDLRREPLEKKVQLFGKSVPSPGKMRVILGKLTLPGGSSGVKIPLSISYATRTELLPDKEWRAGLGLTFNWRQLP